MDPKEPIQKERSPIPSAHAQAETATYGPQVKTSQKPQSAARGGSLSSSKTSDSSVIRSNVQGDEQGEDSDCLMIEESVSDVEEMQ